MEQEKRRLMAHLMEGSVEMIKVRLLIRIMINITEDEIVPITLWTEREWRS